MGVCLFTVIVLYKLMDMYLLTSDTSEMLLWCVTVCQGAEVSEIKKAYRQLSLKYHPDRETGDPIKFMRISKAYNA